MNIVNVLVKITYDTVEHLPKQEMLTATQATHSPPRHGPSVD